jgi:hypothetical protein
MNRTTSVLLGTTLLFASLSIYLYVQLDEQRDRTAAALSAQMSMESRTKKAEQARDAAQHELLEVSRVHAAANTAASMADSTKARGPNLTADVKVDATRVVQSMTDFEKSPETAAALKGFRKDFVRSMYADLLRDLRLDAETTDRVLELLVNRNTNPSKESFQQVDDSMRSLLDPARYEKYKSYQETLPTHQEVSQFRSQLATNRVSPLSDDQEHRLFDALAQEKAASPAPIPANYSAEEFKEQYSKWQDENESREIDRARQILTSEQFDVFKSHVESSARLRHAFVTANTATSDKHE